MPQLLTDTLYLQTLIGAPSNDVGQLVEFLPADDSPYDGTPTSMKGGVVYNKLPFPSSEGVLGTFLYGDPVIDLPLLWQPFSFEYPNESVWPEWVAGKIEIISLRAL